MGVDAADRAVTLIRPEGAGLPTGGTLYDLRVLQAWAGSGLPSRDVELPGGWPFPDAAARARLAAALAAAPGPVLVDGLIGSCCPDEIGDAVGAGGTVLLLIHLPLEAEPGLPDADAAALHRLEQRAIAAAFGVVTPSAFGGRELARRFTLTDEPVIARPGTEPAPAASGSAPPRLVMVGAFTTGKNHTTALEALAGLTDRPWSLSLAGPEPARRSTLPAVRERIVRSGLAPRVRLEGALRGAALDALWDGADLLLLPSLAETYGMVVGEALARGIPCLVAEGTGVVEALTGADPGPPAGATLDPREPAEWRAALADWLDHPELREQWRARALRRRVQLPTWDDTARTIASAIGARTTWPC